MAKTTYERADLLEKEPTKLQRNFIKFIKRQTGYDVDETTMVLFQALRGPFQKSDENQEDLAERRAAAEARKEEIANRPKRKPGRPKKENDEQDEAPAKKAGKGKKAKATAKGKKAKVRAVEADEDDDDDDPFEDD